MLYKTLFQSHNEVDIFTELLSNQADQTGGDREEPEVKKKKSSLKILKIQNLKIKNFKKGYGIIFCSCDYTQCKDLCYWDTVASAISNYTFV